MAAQSVAAPDHAIAREIDCIVHLVPDVVLSEEEFMQSHRELKRTKNERTQLLDFPPQPVYYNNMN
jgi:hypothetical protein